ncbi:MAG: hypothetical protein OEX77_08805 [Candidatus Bathyarchaeota archaeon]|nr:hypothetical protein [Candidatus Bathyarchaeota archaeon]MDH5733917.1 hypothetical protein [Candidatus Bathyarchaeota archaeon]
MPEKDKNFRIIWIRNATFRRLIQVRYALTNKNGKARNPDVRAQSDSFPR